MKKCPVCEKTFEDSMKFCQVDGTELVADEPAFDPYATVVGHKLDLTPEPKKPVETVSASDEVTPAPSVEASVEETAAGESLVPADASPIHETTGSIPIAAPDEVLELPGVDPLKTMYVSEAELKEAFGTGEANENLTEESIMAEPPAAGFGDMAPPPSPFSAPESPLDQAFVRPSYADADTTVVEEEPSSPFQSSEPAPVAEWNPPPAPAASWQDQENMQVQPSSAAGSGPSQGLAIGSLVCGVLSCTICCSMGILLGPAALVMGFMAKKKAEESPSEYGGRGLALGGMITGAVGILFGIGILLYYIIVGAAVLSGGLPN